MPIPNEGRIRFRRKLIFKGNQKYRQRLTFTKEGKVVESKLIKCHNCGHIKKDLGGSRCTNCGKKI